MIATHERQLTDLVKGQPAANYHFREELDTDGLVFNYRLQPGPAQTRNALRIMQREDYPENLINRARQWLENQINE